MNAHIYPSTIENESRMLKIANSLAKAGVFSQIELIGRWREGLPARVHLNDKVDIVRIKPIRFSLMGRNFERAVAVLSWYIKTLTYLARKDLTCVNPHSLPVLPLGALIKTLKSCKLVYDTHELETETMGSKGLKKILYKTTERLFIYKADAVSVVNKSIASWYNRTYAITTPYVIRNVPPKSDIQRGRTDFLKEYFAIPQAETVFLYQGLLSKGRGIQIVLDAFKAHPQRHVVFMGYGELSDTIKEYSCAYPNIHYKPAVAPELIPTITSSADIGLSLIENQCLSYYMCLPNKVFEYLNSGVPMIVSNFPEMKTFIEESGGGWAIEPTEECLAQVINTLTPEALSQKRSEMNNSIYSYGWHLEEVELLKMYKELGYIKSTNA